MLIRCLAAQSQNSVLDSLRIELNHSEPESIQRATALGNLADFYAFLQFDSSIYYSSKTFELSGKLNFLYGKYLGYMSDFHRMNCQGNFPKALDAALNLQRIAEQLKKDSPWVGPYASYFPGVLYRAMEDWPNAIDKFKEAIELQKKIGPIADTYADYSLLALIMLRTGRMDSALNFAQIGYDLSNQSTRYQQFDMVSTAALGDVHLALNHVDSAELLFRRAVEQSRQYDNDYFEARNYNSLALLFARTNSRDSSLLYAHKALQLCLTHNYTEFTQVASKILADTYDKEKKADSALKYLRIMLAAKDSLFSQAKVRQFQQETFTEIQRLERTQNRLRIYGLSAAMFLFLLLAFIMFRSARQRKKAAARIEKAYQELKATQAQLIHSEKMASLGELTAGIAHEIQNPLNFVNNFSEVNAELIQELNSDLSKEQLSPNGREAIEKLVDDLATNSAKIVHHGKRADGIVKSMMQHARAQGGQKELTDLNNLASEWLQLCFHGMRSKEKGFQCEVKTDLDPNLSKCNVDPQNIGRVLMNLYNNAFYAVNQMQHSIKPEDNGSYKPEVLVRTQKIQMPSGNQSVQIVVKDNGNGIPKQNIDKIFQPFFTTKPTGQGTGLGLSLAYDIIKAHGGEIKVESTEGEGSQFVIQLHI